MKWITVTAIPSVGALWNAVLPAVYRVGQLSDRELIKAWKYACTARYMVERGISPRSEKWNQRHMLRQCADLGHLRTIEQEVKRRHLDENYGIEITDITI